MSRNTVSARIDALLAAGLLTPAGSEASSGGRPPARIAFNGDAGVILAIDLGATHATVAVTNLAADILDMTTTTDIDMAAGPTRVLDSVFKTGNDLLEPRRARTRTCRCRHWTARRRRTFDRQTDQPADHARMGPVRRTRLRATQLPRTRSGRQRRQHPRARRARTDLARRRRPDLCEGCHRPRGGHYFRLAASAGSAGSRRRHRTRAGPLQPRLAPTPGDERGLGSIASGPAIATELRKQGVDARDSQDVIRLVGAGDERAISATRQAGRELGEVLSTLVNTLNPAVIVVGGSMSRAGEHLLAGVREVVYRRSIPLATRNLMIVQSRAGERAGVLGAAILVTQHVLSPANVEARLAEARSAVA